MQKNIFINPIKGIKINIFCILYIFYPYVLFPSYFYFYHSAERLKPKPSDPPREKPFIPP